MLLLAHIILRYLVMMLLLHVCVQAGQAIEQSSSKLASVSLHEVRQGVQSLGLQLDDESLRALQRALGMRRVPYQSHAL